MRLARLALPLALPLALAGCLSPRDACIADASRDLGTVEALIRETQGNLARGFAIETSQEVRVSEDRCPVESPDGETAYVACEDTDVIEVERPVAIDLRAEQAKLNSLVERRARLEGERDARVRGCMALPDE